MKKLHIISLLILYCHLGMSQNQTYQIKLIRAAPGALQSLIDDLKSDSQTLTDAGQDAPYLIRHSQGDQWDLMIISSVESIESHFGSTNQSILSSTKVFGKAYGDPIFDKISWMEESFVDGPDKATFKSLMTENDFYHLEIFTALAGKQSELLKQREMENVYLDELNRKPNFVFTRIAGASWDIFTLGVYKDIMEYASSGNIPFETEDEAAKVAGFESVTTIGTYLRELLLEHHDTLGKAVR